jgi:hypothetical protein
MSRRDLQAAFARRLALGMAVQAPELLRWPAERIAFLATDTPSHERSRHDKMIRSCRVAAIARIVGPVDRECWRLGVAHAGPTLSRVGAFPLATGRLAVQAVHLLSLPPPHGRHPVCRQNSTDKTNSFVTSELPFR